MERVHGTPKTWLVTLDGSLPRFLPFYGETSTPLALTLDGLLLWVAPFALEAEQKGLAEVFSDAVRYQLLPHDRFLDARDFEVFSDLNYSCRELPAEDVEGCLRYLKAKAISLDVSRPEQRELLAREVARYFADPGRRYKSEISTLEHQTEQMDKEVRDLQVALERTREENAALARQIAERDAAERSRRFDDATFRRLLSAVVCATVGTFVMLLVVAALAKGETWLQRVIEGWEIIVVTWFILVAVFALMLVGVDGLRRLPSVVRQLFKIEQ